MTAYPRIPLPRALGQTRAVITTCPHCSYLVGGTCVICEDGDPHPGCEGCVNGRLRPPPWWENELFVAISTAVVVSVATAIIVPRLEKQIMKALRA